MNQYSAKEAEFVDVQLTALDITGCRPFRRRSIFCVLHRIRTAHGPVFADSALSSDGRDEVQLVPRKLERLGMNRLRSTTVIIRQARLPAILNSAAANRARKSAR